MKAKFYVRSLMFISLLCLGQGVMAAPAYFRSVANGNWSSLSTWQQSTDNVTWVSATEYPLQTGFAEITLQSPYTVTLDIGVSLYGVSVLNVNSGAKLQDKSTTPFFFFLIGSGSISGTIDFTNSSSLGYLGLNSATINASASVAANRIIFYGGSITNNGTITATGSPGCFESQIYGSTTIAGTGTFNFNNLRIINNSTLTSNISGVFNEACSLTIDTGCSFVTGASTTAVYNLSSVTAVGATSICNTSTIPNTKQLVISGNVTNNGSFTAGSATTKNSILSGASNIQFNDSLKVNTPFVTTNSGTVTVATMLTGTGAFTQNTNSTLNYGGATLSITTLNATATGNTVNYFASANQTIANFSYYNLTLSGTTNKTKSLSGPGTILGTVSIQNNSIFSCGGFDLSVGGDWNNSSTNTNAFVASTKSVTLNGSSPQNIINTGSTNGTRFNTLIFNNSSLSSPQISLFGNSLIILNTLQMISGIVNYNSTPVQIGSNSASVNTLIHSGSASSGWFYTTYSSASFQRYFQVGVAVADKSVVGLLPVGTSTDFRPIYISCPISPPTTPTSIKVTQLGASTTTTIVNIADNPGSNIVRQYQGNWPIVASTTTGSYNITAGGTGFGTIGNVSDLRLSLAASVVGTAGTNSGTTTFPLVLRTGLSPANLTNTFYLGSVDATNSPLPVELVFFEGKVNGGVVDLEWQTRSEVNCESFTVLRSIDGKNFLPVGSVDGHGTTNQSHTYQLRDGAPEKGSNYYRLVQHDIDHNSEIIKTIVAEVRDGLSAISLFPNPVRTDTEVTLVMTGLRPKAEQEVRVIDIQGRIHTIFRITTDESGSFRGQLKTDLTQGLYVIKINASILKLVVY